MSIHPIMANEEIEFICDSIKEVANNFKKWAADYTYNPSKNEYVHNSNKLVESEIAQNWFKI